MRVQSIKGVLTERFSFLYSLVSSFYSYLRYSLTEFSLRFKFVESAVLLHRKR